MTKRTKRYYASKVFSPSSEGFQSALRIVRAGRRFLIATHRNPDGDALGSALALEQGLRHLGKVVKVYNADPVPYFLKFLPNSKKITSRLSQRERFDGAFVVDCSELGRVGDVFCAHRKLGPVVLLDHHAQGKKEGDVRVVDVNAASSGVVVYWLLKRLGAVITPEIATCLYVTLVTDTGDFRYANTSPSVLNLASSLIEAGALPDQIHQKLHQSQPAEKLKLLAQALNGLELFQKGRIGVITVTRRMLRSTRGSVEMSDDFVDYPRSLASVEVAVLLREVSQGWRVSLRSKKHVNVGSVAASFGGGGHVRAAGFTIKGGRSAACFRILQALSRKL